MNYERLPPPTLAEATELVEATVAAFQTGIGKVRTAATVLGLADGGGDVPPPVHVQQVIIGRPPARMASEQSNRWRAISQGGATGRWPIRITNKIAIMSGSTVELLTHRLRDERGIQLPTRPMQHRASQGHVRYRRWAPAAEGSADVVSPRTDTISRQRTSRPLCCPFTVQVRLQPIGPKDSRLSEPRRGVRALCPTLTAKAARSGAGPDQTRVLPDECLASLLYVLVRMGSTVVVYPNENDIGVCHASQRVLLKITCRANAGKEPQNPRFIGDFGDGRCTSIGLPIRASPSSMAHIDKLRRACGAADQSDG